MAEQVCKMFLVGSPSPNTLRVHWSSTFNDAKSIQNTAQLQALPVAYTQLAGLYRSLWPGNTISLLFCRLRCSVGAAHDATYCLTSNWRYDPTVDSLGGLQEPRRVDLGRSSVRICIFVHPCDLDRCCTLFHPVFIQEALGTSGDQTTQHGKKAIKSLLEYCKPFVSRSTRTWKRLGERFLAFLAGVGHRPTCPLVSGEVFNGHMYVLPNPRAASPRTHFAHRVCLRVRKSFCTLSSSVPECGLD
ncbi:hypothetical protein BCV70DRAFT_122479 [Testicularia cyperi]|uniref:Uncharacterized protein n=1 Tax=Testicularia cyperi TaxID=1882483 RepID=A0A317XL34_9BASI|nr:hypothetical protein BCV70DRAFT_122479 [Testicularia cyperi]